MAPSPAAPDPRAERAARRRAAILHAALDEFAARGFAAARLDDVARRAGVAKGTIYLYFADKETLFQELIRAEIGPVVGVMAQVADSGVPLRVLLRQIADVFVREVLQTRRKDVIRLILTEGPRFPALAAFYHREVVARMMATMRAMLRRAADRGEPHAAALSRFPQLVAAPAMVGVLWSGLFERFEPLDVRAMLHTHFDILFGEESDR